MLDPFGRHIQYLRVSVTDRCDFRCVYCMSENMQFIPRKEILTFEEMERLCRIFISIGIKKIRITGGEPLVRRNVMSLFRSLGKHIEKGILQELTLTTNGSQLHHHAQALYDCGVKRINVSVDTLKAEKFQKITRRGNLDQVLNGLDIARKVGLKIKINCVALKGFNEDEIHHMVAQAGAMGDDLTFIEIMPMGDMGEQQRLGQYWPLSDLRAKLEEKWTLHDDDYRSGGPARYVRCAETKGLIGFITPLTHNFCQSCNRIRLTCRGHLYLCLGQEDRVDLRAILRENPYQDQPIKQAILKALEKKPKAHDFMITPDQTRQTERYMNLTGG